VDDTGFTEHRGRLFGLAYRMLGSATDAEDVLQEAFLRWSAADRAAIVAPGAWLAKVVTNLCLTALTSARARRETYVGPWLPEPVLTERGPDETAELGADLSLALLTVLERLTPSERAVFVLREAFGYEHAAIGEVLGRTPESSRQLHSRARRRVQEPRRASPADPAQVRRLVERFLAAARDGDLGRLESLLATDVVSWSDGGGRVSAARMPVHGPERVARLFAGLARKAGAEASYEVRTVNGEPALLAEFGGQYVVISLEADSTTDEGRIVGVRAVVNPDKLRYLRHQLSRSTAFPSPS
jgi:RNA polymerase sigma-70 factor (ECF subfamily)